MTNDSSTRGFTLVELMITLVIGMVVLAGVISVFISNTRLSASLADRTERLGDLYTASHIMQTELRGAQKASIILSGNNKITYTPLDPYCTTLLGLPAPAQGSFTYQTKNPNTANAISQIAWKRPTRRDGIYCNNGAAQELIRNLDPVIGMIVSQLNPVADPYKSLLGIDLYSVYTNPNQATKTIALSFKVWVRN